MADHNSGRTTPEQEAAFWNQVAEMKAKLTFMLEGSDDHNETHPQTTRRY